MLTMSITVIFLGLLLSLFICVWRHPTSPRSLRAVPIYGAPLPAPNTAPPMHSVATHGRSFAYLMLLQDTRFVIYRWWTRATRNGINRIPPIITEHHERTIVRAPPNRAREGIGLSTRTPTPTTIAFTSSGGSTVGTIVDSEDMELHELDGMKAPSTSSAETYDAVITHVQAVMTVGEPIVRVDGGPVSVASEPSLPTDYPTVEVDITDVDKVAMGRQALR